MTNGWERLESVIRWSGMSTHAFAMDLGLKRSENLYRIRREKNGISKKLAELISNRHPEISRSWLLTGDGTMLISENDKMRNSAFDIPYYEADLSEVIRCMEDPDAKKPAPLYMLNLPFFPHCDLAVKIHGDAMTPLAPQGAVAILKKITSQLIIYGEIYVIATEDATLMREVRKSEKGEEFITLAPRNTNGFDSFDIPRKSIRQLFLVSGVINKNI